MIFWFPWLNHLSCPENVPCRAWGSLDQFLQGCNLFSTWWLYVMQYNSHFQRSLQIIKIPTHLWYIYESIHHIYASKFTTWWVSFVIHRHSERLDSASGGARSPASLPRRLLLNSPAPWLLLSSLWTGGPYDLWPRALNVLAIHCCYNKVQRSKSGFDSVGMCSSCSHGFWHEDSLKFWIVR